ncbi:MAG: DnaJ C-terminal domain-containing protein [Gammaproteobacteria bacterium]
MAFKDYYKILGVDRDADADSIRKAYRRLARKYHPDVSKEADAEDRFKELQEAYEVLRDPEKRQAYDRFGEHWKAGMEQGAAAAGGAGGPGGGTHYQYEDISPEDVAGFEEFINSVFGDRGFGGGYQGRRSRQRGSDEHARLTLTLEEAFKGTTRTISFDVVEPDKNGRLQKRTKTLNVTIPAGVIEGQRIRLAGQGQPGLDEPGDLYIEVHIQPHRDYTLKGRDIYVDVPVTPWEAALGEKVTVKTPGGNVKLTIPAGSQGGQKLKLSGRGVPGKPAGDLYAVLQVIVPKPRNDAERELYRKMAEAMPMNPRQK